MNVVVWARVSSREQREGYSLDAQLRLMREKAKSNGWQIVREFVVAESARRKAERAAFNEMFHWVKANAKREKLQAILSHKLDRVCRNLRDAVRLQELEDNCGVELAFVDNQFGPGAAGALSFNVMAAVAQYYSDNLRSEVLKGLDEKVRQGWPTGLAPYGYRNVDDKSEPVQPHPEKAATLVRMFELYSSGSFTFATLAGALEREGHVFRASRRRFTRGAMSWILSNRFYIGELHRHGQVFEGQYRKLIDRPTFNACQDVMQGRNRRTGNPEHSFGGGLFRCSYCGQAITGERIRRKLKGGEVREHLYYRCANNHPGPDHPTVRWKAADLERAIAKDLGGLRMPSPEIAAWIRNELQAAVSDLTVHRRRQEQLLAKRRSEIAAMQVRLLNAYLTGNVEETVFHSKSVELRTESAGVDEQLAKSGTNHADSASLVLSLFDWTQSAADVWQRSNNAVRREILDAICLNRQLGDVSLVTTKRKPFDVFAERLQKTNSRGDTI
jgi:site-specific DNA recombinase